MGITASRFYIAENEFIITTSWICDAPIKLALTAIELDIATSWYCITASAVSAAESSFRVMENLVRVMR